MHLHDKVFLRVFPIEGQALWFQRCTFLVEVETFRDNLVAAPYLLKRLKSDAGKIKSAIIVDAAIEGGQQEFAVRLSLLRRRGLHLSKGYSG